MIATEQTVFTPHGMFVAMWDEDEDLPVSYRGSQDALAYFKTYLDLKTVSGRGGSVLRFDALEPADLFGFCQSSEFGIQVLEDPEYAARDEGDEDELYAIGSDPVLDAVPAPSANISRGMAALEKAVSQRTTVHRAMYRQGLGWVDFVWGDEGKPPNAKGVRKGGKGISHAMESRERKDGYTPEQVSSMLKRMVMAIADGVETRPAVTFGNTTRVIVGKDGAEVQLLKKPGSNAWVLTVFDVI